MNAKKQYRIVAAVSGIAAALTVGTLAVVLAGIEPSATLPGIGLGKVKLRPVGLSLESAFQEATAAQPSEHPENREAADVPARQRAGAQSGAAQPRVEFLEGFEMPEEWANFIALEEETFYVRAVHEAFLRDIGTYDGALLTVRAVSMADWEALENEGDAAEKLLEHDGTVYYCRKPSQISYPFGEDPEGDKDYYRMQTALQDALTAFFTKISLNEKGSHAA